MDFSHYRIIILLVFAMIFFIWGRWRYDIVALVTLMLAVLLGGVPYREVFSGLENPAVITVACVMVISQAIQRSGVLTYLVSKLNRLAKSDAAHVMLLTSIAAVLSAFMNNVGALALIMPIAIKSARDRNRSPSLVLMPIALGSALGGLTTVIGTPPNLLVANLREQVTGHAFTMFDYSYVGFVAAALGILFVGTIGWRLLPKHRKSATSIDELFQIKDYVTEVRVTEKSVVIGKTVAELENLTEGDFLIIGIIRDSKKNLVVPSEYTLQENDVLIIETSQNDLEILLNVGKLELLHDVQISSKTITSDESVLIEAVVPQYSRIEGRTSERMRLRSRFKMNLLAISRKGVAFKSRLHQTALRAGDVILLQGNASEIYDNIANLDLLPLVSRDIPIIKKPKALIPILIFVVAILLAAVQILPVQLAFAGAVIFMVILNAIPARLIYTSIDWPIIVLLAAMIPVGTALQTTGGTWLISQFILHVSSVVSPTVILGILLLMTMTLSDFMNNAATTVVMAPIAVSIANALQLNVDPFLMTIAIGASCSFLTPVGHQNNMLIMGPGGYKFSDYIRLGLPLEILIVIVSIPMIIWVWPF